MEAEQPLKIMPRAVSIRLRQYDAIDLSLVPAASPLALLADRPLGQLRSLSREQEFQRLYEKLESIQDAIKDLAEQTINNKNAPLPQQPHKANSCSEPSHDDDDDDSSRFPEGDSSFGRQAVVATQIAELTTAHSGPSTALLHEMENLKRLLGENRTFHRTGYLNSSGSHPCPPIPDLLPADFVLWVLRTVNDTTPYLFTFYSLYDRTQVEEICTKVYFPVQPATSTEITLCHGILCTLLCEPHTAAHPELASDQMSKFRQICQGIFQAGLESHEVMAIPTFENALILSLAMNHAQNEAKLPLQWTLTSVAARHCLALSYHREDRLAQLPPRKAERARRLFWRVYISDKIVSSQLGRTSVIQDYDLDTQLCPVSKEASRAPWDQASVAFVEYSRIQGHIYEALYSVSANNLDSAGRTHIVSKLAERLDKWHDSWTRIDHSQAHHREIFENTFGPVEIVYYSVLTLLHRGATSSKSMVNISPACLQAAYQCLNAHLAYSSSLKIPPAYILPGYAIWLFNITSFIAFAVIFTNCIVNESSSDLELLGKVLLSLEQIAAHFDYSKWQFSLCNALYRIADAFIRLRREDQGASDTNLQNPFLHGWSWLDTSLSSMLEMGGQIEGLDSL
ncbi:hypothetical protein NM208_g2307 [Fusarium decemcellulare]|uniref:Uncharacterized protein n=1 Tax=Fusarium decemcellulare TaxID=57161 RepID=A0ACC1SSV3_9HYPO|nr:hypothetical protein NM208_g2307 [Fusarium decemcellulare]